MKIQCMKCGQPTQCPAIDQPHVVNLPACSVITIQHAEPFPCEHCGTVLAPGVVQAQMAFAGYPVAPKQHPKILVVPGRG